MLGESVCILCEVCVGVPMVHSSVNMLYRVNCGMVHLDRALVVLLAHHGSVSCGGVYECVGGVEIGL